MSKMQRAKSRLGRGLSSLISVSDLPVETSVPAEEPRTPAPTPAAERAATEVPEKDLPTASDASETDMAAGGRASPPKAQPAAPPATAVARSTESQVGTASAEIPLERIVPNPHQPRRQFQDAALAELAASLKSNGLIQPVIVRQAGDRYELVAGERRLRAAKLAGLKTIPAIVRDVDAFSQAQMALVENIHREDLNPMERAAAYRSLIDQLGLTQSELATRLGEERSTVANFLRLLELAEPVKAAIRDGKLSLGHAKVLAGVTDVLEQERLAALAVSQGLSVRNLERLVANPTTPRRATATPPASAHLAELEKTFARQLGMRVQIRATGASKGKGRVVIHYGSLDQFDQLLEKLGVERDDL